MYICKCYYSCYKVKNTLITFIYYELFYNLSSCEEPGRFKRVKANNCQNLDTDVTFLCCHLVVHV